MTTTVDTYNETDTLADLLEILAEHPLDRKFERYGDFHNPNPKWVEGSLGPNENGGRCYLLSPTQPEPGTVTFFGNFYNVSHAFNVTTTDPEVIARLKTAIAENKARPDYQSQEPPEPYDETLDTFIPAREATP